MRRFRDIAELTNTKQLNGGLAVRCTAGLSFLLEEGMTVHVVPPVLDSPRQLTVARVESTGPDGGVVWFQELASANDALPFVGCHCLVERSLIDNASSPSVIFDSEIDISGWEVYEADEGFVGVVKELREMPGQLMLVIDRSSCDELLVPLVDEFIVDADEAHSTLRLMLPNGFLEL